MQNILRNISEMNALLLEGKAMDAFEKFYHEEVVMRENENPATTGKNANREREIAFFGGITEFRGAVLLGVATGEDISTTIWQYDYTHRDLGLRNYTQVNVQRWKDGKIIHEQFFYGN